MRRTFSMSLQEAVTCIWDLCAGPDLLDLSAGYNKSGGGPLVCDVHRNAEGYRVYLTYLGATNFFGLSAEILISEINGQARLLWSIAWPSERFLRRSVTASAWVIGLSVVFGKQIELSDGIAGNMPTQMVILAIAGSIFFYTGLKLVVGILDRNRLEDVLRRTFDGVTVSSVPARNF